MRYDWRKGIEIRGILGVGGDYCSVETLIRVVAAAFRLKPQGK
jgi:hypothetical protein